MLKRFVYWTSGKKVELEILEKVSETKIKVNVTVDGNEIAREETATICRVYNIPGKLFLQIRNVCLTICNKNKPGNAKKNREIADWIWMDIQDRSTDTLVYNFTTHHKYNWEEVEI